MNYKLFIFIFALFLICTPNFLLKKKFILQEIVYSALFSTIMYFTYDILKVNQETFWYECNGKLTKITSPAPCSEPEAEPEPEPEPEPEVEPEPKCSNDVIIDVGSSSTQTKKVKLPEGISTVSTEPVNTQHPYWSDTFNIITENGMVSVTRTDANSGWGQPLQLKGLCNK